VFRASACPTGTPRAGEPFEECSPVHRSKPPSDIELGVVSDTHGYFHPDLASVFEGVDLILHAGDVGDPAILDGLEAVAPVRAVFGNVDGPDVRQRQPETERFEAGGLRFWMTHIAGRPGRWQRGMDRRLAEADGGPPDVFVCGHSHALQIERVAALSDMLFLNPGAAGRQGRHQEKTCVRLHLDDGHATDADVVHLDE
jgi:putative phosphoesterase